MNRSVPECRSMTANIPEAASVQPRRIDKRSGPVENIDVEIQALWIGQLALLGVRAYETPNRLVVPTVVIVVQTCRLANRFARELVGLRPSGISIILPEGLVPISKYDRPG